MKYFYALVGLMFMFTSLNAQSPRLCLIEEATNASCGPCASQNPAFDILLDQNRDIITAIKYHWYFPGYDPMHDQNPDENDNRVAYYGINGVPTATIDGDIPNGPTFQYPGGPHGYTQQLLEDSAAIPSPFELTLSHHLSPNQDSIYVDMMIVATGNVSGNLIAQMAVVEKHIHFVTPPGGNGEKDFSDVMRKMIPDENGTVIPTVFLPGEYMILQGSWKLQNIYDLDELGVVGFIQRNNDKEVMQAGNSSAEPLTPLYNNEATITKIAGVTETNCLGTVSPKITIRNNGADPITNVTIKYRVNDEGEFTYPWTGNLSFLQSAVIQLPEIGFTVENQNHVTIYTENPNGSSDEYVKNDTIKQSFEKAKIAPATVNFMIRTDVNPAHNTWEVYDASGDVVFSGGPYPNPGTIYTETMEFTDGGCYKFKIYDSAGDGLLMPGFFALYYGGGNYICTGTQFGSVDSAFFTVATGVGIPEPNSSLAVNIYPNPSRDKATVSFFLENTEPVSYTVYDLVGSGIFTKNLGLLSSGPQQFQLDNEGLKPGIYLIRFEIGSRIFTKRISIIN